MKFTETKLKGSFLVEIEKISDSRGFFGRIFCAQEFVELGLKPPLAQTNLSFNPKKGTLRGLHYQIYPVTEAKLIRCSKGAIYEVIVDMRPQSPTYLSHIGVELTAENHQALYVPEMFANGYQALTDGAEAMYQVSECYTPGYERGIRYDDPVLNINWPISVSEISLKDTSWPLLESVLIGG
ncbi:MAG TPA: dTDP-4-dehydrorhamnose 3,5-epimerase [Cyanobacteria bacterium UBA11149]|nr:dTDP-4-dehydrorhamnose 3,5-epimerase [Cyanobacteria bacterium UBA11367]HBE58458.1 dTDP-4-dehydrorhamnose 3,5-epimerase [Cyanobacteria bacterium UBA11366]HBK62753.1 dTDP-4-dehydrorhamnose 3,5-epimerase [Cyanobacteria bacterium UBA11166]HBR73485.1 dTDP-4-dehydrorhamnose 3,5-epimerase [Cyanobacteria bacterium UBA11159]HBS71818.1 dTDP-4-dehydrorhamnose 3,5-epimerase [Cyanobacteria bacterium UBA11153]HBW92024.1 dTDP-4-dehydrorhamnose 3,5-epimerase [Cyanobacteria bacterium UBA11149]HCA94254.1 dT